MAEYSKLTEEVINETDDRESMIKVDDVTMVFNIASEQLNNLKEYAIAIARHELMFKEFKALQHISIDVKRGDVFGILGTNGSGKSTLMKVIAGVLDPTEGTCTVNGNIAPLIELGAGFDMDLTARENVYLNGALLGYSKKFIDENFDAIIEFAEVEDFLDMPLKNYSSGMVSRIAFAIATVIVPEILLVDEVLSVGDFMFQKKCENRIKELIDQHGVTVLIVSHSNEQIARLCNKAAWIEKGHMRMCGKAQDVCRVYGALGGRKGSSESETRIFDLLTNRDEHDEYPVNSVFGGDPVESSVNLALARCNPKGDSADNKKVESSANLARARRNPQKDSIDNKTVESSVNLTHTRRNPKGGSVGDKTAILAPNSTHINSVFAASLAQVFDAPVIQTRSDYTSAPVEHYLALNHPQRILFVDCGKAAPAVLDRMQSLDWKPEILDLSGDGFFPGFSLELINRGAEQGWWGDTFVLMEFTDVAESVPTMPLLSSLHAPVLMTLASEGLGKAELDDILNRVDTLGFKRVLAIGPSLDQALIDTAREKIETIVLGREGTQFARSFEITKWAFEHRGSETCEICIASLDSTQWSYVFSCSGYLAPTNGVVMMEDSLDLDGINTCIDFLHDNAAAISDVTFTGSTSSFTESEYDLLNTAYYEGK